MVDILCWIELHPGLAAWVQAVFSVIAIVAAGLVAWWQVHKQNEMRINEQFSADEKIRLLVFSAIQLGLESIENAAKIAAEAPLALFKDGLAGRFHEVINLIGRVDMTRLTKIEMAAAIQVIKGCSLAAATIQTPKHVHDQMTNISISDALRTILDTMKDVKKPFADIAE